MKRGWDGEGKVEGNTVVAWCQLIEAVILLSCSLIVRLSGLKPNVLKTVRTTIYYAECQEKKFKQGQLPMARSQ